MKCSFESCDKPRRKREWCEGHYAQHRAGKQLHPLNRSSSQRFQEKVSKGAGCWEWLAWVDRQGYGHFYDGETMSLAHRFSFEMYCGPIPSGMQIDHMCHNRRCVNPDHLQAVTPRENNENRLSAQSNSKSGIRGVFWSERCKKWIACVGKSGRVHYAGTHSLIEDAERAARAKRLELQTNNLLDRSQK